MKNLETNALLVLKVNTTRRTSMGFFDFLKGKSKEDVEAEELRLKMMAMEVMQKYLNMRRQLNLFLITN